MSKKVTGGLSIFLFFIMASGTSVSPIAAQLESPPLPSTNPVASLVVESADMSGTTFEGMWVELRKDGILVQSGWTPFTALVLSGNQYEIFIQNWEDIVFDHWEDGSTDQRRAITLTQDATLTAFFQTGTTPTNSPPVASLVVESSDMSGTTFEGMWVEIWRNGMIVQSGWTPFSTFVQTETQYVVFIQNWENIIFNHWEDGTTNQTRAFALTQDATFTAFFNSPPTASDDSVSTPMNQAVTIDVLANDSDPDNDTLGVISTSSPANGAATVNANNTITYTPNQDFAGNDSFDYSISDGNGGSDTATVSVTVYGTLTTISTCCNPLGVDINVNTNTIYVRAANIVSVIDGTTDTITKAIDSGFRPGQISVNNATNMVYATVDRFIQVINGTDNTTIDVVIVADQQFINTVDVNPRTNMIYVALRGFPSEPHKVIDGDTNEIVDTIPKSNSGDSYVAVNQVTNMIYFAEGNTVVVVDGSTNTVVERIQGIPSGPIDVNPLTNMIYVAYLGDSSNPIPTNVTVIDGNTNTIVTEVLVGTLPRGIVVNEVTNMIYVTNNVNDNVSVIDGESNHVVDTIPIRDGDGGERDGPQGIAVNSETNKVYIANSVSDTITVLQGIGR